MCNGCGEYFPGRSFQEHIPGCARLKGINASKTHANVKHVLEDMARRSHTPFVDEPTYEEVTITGADGRKKRPDITFHLPTPITVDVKGINPASISHAGKSWPAIVKDKTAKVESLYGEAARRRSEKLLTPCFSTLGNWSEDMNTIINELFTDFDVAIAEHERDRLSVTIVTSAARVLIQHSVPADHWKRC